MNDVQARFAPEYAAHSLLRMLCDGFYDDASWVDRCRVVGAGQLPEAPRRLLDHHQHMTPTLRNFCGGELELRVDGQRRVGDWYSRKIALFRRDTGEVVESGIMRIDLRCVNPAVREAILAQETPLGDILMRHGVLTRVEPKWFLHVPTDSPVMRSFGRAAKTDGYGRIATIHCDGQEAVELLEVVAGC